MEDTPAETLEAPEAEETTTEPLDAEAANAALAKVRREAAAHRTSLRDTQAERDALAQRVEQLQRREVERIAAPTLSQPSDIWLDGPELDSLLGEDGSVVEEAVQAAAKAAVDRRPAMARVARGSFDGGVRQTVTPKPTFGEVFAKTLKS